MSSLTTADLRYRINYLGGSTATVAILIADRVAADAICRKYGYGDNAELKMYAAAWNAARRTTPTTPETWEEFAGTAIDVSLVDTTGRPVKVTNGVLMVDGEDVDEDPTQPGT